MLSSADFEWDELWWTTKVQLTEWTGAADGDATSDADEFVSLIFAPEGRGDEPLTRDEIALVAWFIENQTGVVTSVREALLAWYPTVRSDLQRFARANDLPDVLTAANLPAYVRPLSINVHNVHVEAVPYLGFEFAASWESEHGIGVLTHGTRVVEIGGADTAILRWIAVRDSQKS